MVDGGRWQSREQSDAERAQNSDLPSVRVDGLRPDTEYEARIAVYDNYSIRSLGKSTGVIEFRTDREFEILCQRLSDTRKSSYLEKRFCKQFSESSPYSPWHGSREAAEQLSNFQKTFCKTTSPNNSSSK